MSKKFTIFTKITLVSIFLVVIMGSVVRMSGSGMGCPDWPKCFDSYIPTTDVSQLPENYKEIYSKKREKKLNRFVKFLSSLGFEEKANEIFLDKTLLEEQDFNAANTWTEYMNRLSGALAGLFILSQMIWAFANFKKQKLLSLLTFLILLITIFQAWFGAMVVATNIVPWVLTIHMLLAIVMLIFQLHVINISKNETKNKLPISITLVTTIGLVLMLIQILWGTEVRQQIDLFSKSVAREYWIDSLQGIYFYHRSMAIVLSLIGIGIFFLSKKEGINIINSRWIIGIIILEAVIGKSFQLFGMPPILQPTHLLLSMILFSFMYHSIITNKSK